MKISKTFWAPMESRVLITTLFVTLLCMALPVCIYKSVQEFSSLATAACIFPVVLLLGFALFAVKSYHLEDRTLCIKRGLWTTRVPLDPLDSAEVLPGAMEKSWRICGNSGMFGWIGSFRNEALGSYRAWVTDRQKTVVLKSAGKTYVVSPIDPGKFAEAVRASRG